MGLPRTTYPITVSGRTRSVEEPAIIQSRAADCGGPRARSSPTKGASSPITWRRRAWWPCPPDANRAERGLRRTVLVRKKGFRFQSGAGAKTHKILMRVRHTLRKRGHDAQTHVKWGLDRRATGLQRDP